MVGNVTSSTLQDQEGEPPTQEYWDKIKPDVFRIYMEGDKSGNIKPANLKNTMAEIQRLHGLQGCVRTWKDKIKEWGFSKNLSTRDKQWIAAKWTKRKQEGKDTDFFHGRVRIAPTKIQNRKRRKTGTMSSPLSAPTPPNITYNTPSPSCKNSTSEQMFEEPTTHHSPLPPVSTTSHACWIRSPDSERQRLTTPKADMQQSPSISMIDVWMTDKNQPWSQYTLSRQISDDVERVRAESELLLEQLDAELAKHETKFEDVQASEYLSDGQKYPPDLHCIGDRFLPKSHSTIVNEQWEEIVEESSLESVGSLGVKLANFHIEHDEFAPQTLKKEFELAKALEGMGQYEEAEYHCRRILDIHAQIIVQAFLGEILAKTHRFGEATFLLFHALAGFIILFIQNSLDENARLFARIEAVMIELLLRSEEGAPSLAEHWSLMRDTLQKPTSDGEIYQICPQLFLHGFSFAHECLALGLVNSDQYLLDSAGCLYRDLLGRSFHQLDVHHAIEKATAHRGYARLLRKEKKWIPSAKQWLLACESTINSDIHDRDLIELLESDYHKLLLHLNCEPHEEGSLKENMKRALSRIGVPSPFAMDHVPEPVQRSHVEEYLLSSDLPLPMIVVGHSVISHVARFGLFLGLRSSAHGDKDRTSTMSMTASSSRMSHPWAKTMSIGETRGLGMVL